MSTTNALEYSTQKPGRMAWLPRLTAQAGPALGLALIVVLFSVLRPSTFATVGNWQIMLQQTAVVGTAALGMTLVIISGGIDLSVGSNIALTTVVVAKLLSDGWSPILAATGGIAVGAACGALIGWLVAYGGLAPFIVTLGMWGAVRGLAKRLADERTVDAGPETWLNDILRMLRPSEQWMLVPIGVWATLIMAVGVALLLRYTRFGRHIFAIGSNELTARLCGVPVPRTKMLIYVIAGMFGAMAGVMVFSSLTIGDPTTANGKELDVIAAVVIGGASLSGGQGTILGSLVGALIMTVIANGCTKVGMPNSVQEMVTGGIIILASAVDRWRQMRSARAG